MKIGSLFSGIGGLELGLEWSGIGETVWQCEIDPFCRQVLAKHWPSVTRFDDITKLSNPPAVDLICGGFPCQDVSSAGKGAGIAIGTRSGLWFEFRRIIEECRPNWVVVENVASGKRRWLPTVRRDLHLLGYDSQALGISAADMGAPHLRKRIFVIAHPYGQESPTFISDVDGAGRKGPGAEAPQRRVRLAAGAWRAPFPDFLRVADGLSRGLDSPRARIKALGNAVVPQCAEIVGKVIRSML